MKRKIEVKQDQVNEQTAEFMAVAIVEIGKAMKKLSETRLKREAVVTLIKDKTGFTKNTIEIVLNNLEQLEETWLKKK